jgi:hypothetical protein
MMSRAFSNVKELLPEIIDKMATYEYNVNLLSGAERNALAQVSAEAGFENNSTEFTDLRKKLVSIDRRLEDMDVINQHTVWIGDHNELHITVFEGEEDKEHDKIVASLRDLPDLQKAGWITHSTAMLVFEWYMEKLNKER